MNNYIEVLMCFDGFLFLVKMEKNGRELVLIIGDL
jgi:hypothetical protein